MFSSRSLDYIARSANITTDALVLILTWIKTADIWRESKRIEGLKVTVGMLLLRDGTLYFGMSLILNVVTLVLNVLSTGADGSLFSTLLNAVSANLIARLMLDLRSVNELGANSSRHLSSINFNARSLGGNIGAPLGIEDSTWATGPADDVANERNKQYEEVAVPFRAGLGLDTEEIALESVTPYVLQTLQSVLANPIDLHSTNCGLQRLGVVEFSDNIEETQRIELASTSRV
ncbi:hypothetical protein EIP91_003889 [Steccherinum ochraceum]|uniref:Uncharacterized protein n=1 Tax=Steccherinum ochraceum TaxID=92696 RepID=A0A4R0RD23_9APHY|nr:hypothetical protein EIP91_003889 [Steccherinum ochraceum]